jgi:hypothetical protein
MLQISHLCGKKDSRAREKGFDNATLPTVLQLLEIVPGGTCRGAATKCLKLS